MSDSAPKSVGPGAPPSQVLSALELMLKEWNKVESDRREWNYTKSELLNKIQILEKEKSDFEKIKSDLSKRIQVLEYGIRQERAKGGQRPDERSDPRDVNQKVPNKARSKGKLSPSSKSGYYTLPSNLRSDALSPGRQNLLREYLVNNGFLKELQIFDDKMDKLAGKDPESELNKGNKGDSRKNLNIFNKPGGNKDKQQPAPIKKKKDEEKEETKESEEMSTSPIVLESKAPAWKPLITLRSHIDGVRCVVFHPTEPVLLSGSEDGTVKYWNLSEPLKNKKKKIKQTDLHLEPLYTFLGHKGMITSVACKADTKNNVAYTASTDGNVIAWRLPSSKQDPYAEFGKCGYFRKSVYKHTDAVWSLAIHPNKNILFSACADSKVYAWKVDEDETVAVQKYTVDHKDSKNVVSIPTTLSLLSTDSNKLLVGYLNGDLSVIDVETGKTLSNILSSEPESGEYAWSANHTKHMTSIACHPTQSLVLTGHVDQCVRYFDITKGSCVHVLRAHRDSVTSVSVDSTGQYFVSSSHDQGVRFWDLSTRKIVQDLDPHQTHAKKFDESVHSVVYHPSQPVLASGGADAVIKIYS